MSRHRFMLIAMTGIVVSHGATACNRPPRLEDLARELRGGMTKQECESRVTSWTTGRVNLATAVGVKEYFYEFGVHVLDPDGQSGVRVPIWLCLVSNEGYWGTYRLRAVRADTSDAYRAEHQRALDAAFASDTEMTWQARLSERGTPERWSGRPERIAAAALLAIGNAAQIAERFPGRFVVEGRVLDVVSERGVWGGSGYTVRIIGSKNTAGLVNSWVECEMSDEDGLTTIGPGHCACVEGEFDRYDSPFVWMKKCRLGNAHDADKSVGHCCSPRVITGRERSVVARSMSKAGTP